MMRTGLKMLGVHSHVRLQLLKIEWIQILSKRIGNRCGHMYGIVRCNNGEKDAGVSVSPKTGAKWSWRYCFVKLISCLTKF